MSWANIIADIFKDKSNAVKEETFHKINRRHVKKNIEGNKNSKWVTIDDFGNRYRAVNEEDKTQTISITLPSSLLVILDKTRENIPRSRYIREMIEHCLNIEQVDK